MLVIEGMMSLSYFSAAACVLFVALRLTRVVTYRWPVVLLVVAVLLGVSVCSLLVAHAASASI